MQSNFSASGTDLDVAGELKTVPIDQYDKVHYQTGSGLTRTGSVWANNFFLELLKRMFYVP